MIPPEMVAVFREKSRKGRFLGEKNAFPDSEIRKGGTGSGC